jgi:hypothetical protein
MNRLTIVGDTEGGYGNSVDDTLLYHRNVVSHSGRAASPAAATVLCNDRKGILPSGRFSRISKRTYPGRSCGSESHRCLKRLRSSLRWLQRSLCW